MSVSSINMEIEKKGVVLQRLKVCILPGFYANSGIIFVIVFPLYLMFSCVLLKFCESYEFSQIATDTCV